jgi:hypothetical protein
VLFIAGDQVPVIPLFEVVGSALKGDPVQIGATCVNVGVEFVPTVIVPVAVAGGQPPVVVTV